VPETIKVEVDEALARNFRRRAVEIYGYKRGTVKKAVEEMMKFSFRGKADWHSLRGKTHPHLGHDIISEHIF